MTVAAQAIGLRSLTNVRPLYEVPEEDIASELLIPAMRAADRVRIMAGFFSSHALSQLAPGLAAFIASDNQALELLVSPMLSDEDRDALERAVKDPVKVAEEALARLSGPSAIESAIASHAVDCLSYLVAQDRLRVKLVLMERGMFHPKVWLFEHGGDLMAVHGSSNPTVAGLLYNGETVSVERPWVDGEAATARAQGLNAMFAAYWENRRSKSITLDLPEGLRFAGNHEVSRVPTTDDFWRAWYDDAKNGLAPPLPDNVSAPEASPRSVQRLEIPATLTWDSGRFSHQGAAIRAWEQADRRGILEIATGGGKTLLSLVAAARLQDLSDLPLLVMVVAPTRPLLDQWQREVAGFGIRSRLVGAISARDRIAEMHGVVAALKHGVAKSEVLIMSNRLFVSDSALRNFLAELRDDIRVLLIADEVHNLGTKSFADTAPTAIQYRLGLSATPIRQYDAAGTDALFDYFGAPVFQFSLDEAIANGCLTPYSYTLHEVTLSDEEMEVWERISEQLRRRGFFGRDEGQADVSEEIQRLLEKRRSVLEHADEKIGSLRRLLRAVPPADVQRTLIYTSAKRDPLDRDRQITQVNRLLNELGIISHQLTYSETGGAKARQIIGDFAAGTYQALTCMKVLDEGVDVPATTHAFILASSTVRREWVQRRGRVLRTAPGKDIAHIHDFFVVPPNPDSKEGRAILRGELERADEFSRLAVNAWDNDGPRLITERYE